MDRAACAHPRISTLNTTFLFTTSPDKLQKALYFPDIEGTPLDKRETVHTTDLCLGKVSLISILSSQISEVCSLIHKHSGVPHVQSPGRLKRGSWLSRL